MTHGVLAKWRRLQPAKTCKVEPVRYQHVALSVRVDMVTCVIGARCVFVLIKARRVT